MREIIGEFGDVELMFGDFNARHPHWSGGLDERIYLSGSALLEIGREGGFEVCLAKKFTYRNIGVIDITMHGIPHYFTHGYVDSAGLDHVAQVLSMDVVEPLGMIGSGIPWRKVEWDVLVGNVESVMGAEGVLDWDCVWKIVGDIPRAPRRKIIIIIIIIIHYAYGA